MTFPSGSRCRLHGAQAVLELLGERHELQGVRLHGGPSAASMHERAPEGRLERLDPSRRAPSSMAMKDFDFAGKSVVITGAEVSRAGPAD